MKNLVMAIMALALLTAPAAAQMGGSRRGGPSDDKKGQDSRPKIDEKAYKAALKRIPEPKEKFDPWGGVAPAPAKKPQ